MSENAAQPARAGGDAPDWREMAARVMDALAENQDQINAQHPEHVKCYPSWEMHARWCRWHAEMFRTGKPFGSGAGVPTVLAALAAAPQPATSTVPAPYTNEIGEAGEAYFKRFPYAHPLPALWRWQELWDAMAAAAPAAVEREALTHEAMKQRRNDCMNTTEGFRCTIDWLEGFQMGFRDAERAHGIGSSKEGGDGT